MAELVGLNGIHSLEGFLCDLCGGACDPQAHELNALDCTFSNCSPESAVYHQDCLEKYLKGIRLEKSRKTGFKCPRGCGKGTKHDTPCPGKVNKSHPIHTRNDEKRKKAVPPPVVDIFKPKVKAAASEAPKAELAKKNKENARGDKEKAKASTASAAKPKPTVMPIQHAAKSPTATKQQIESIRKGLLAAKGLARPSAAGNGGKQARPAPVLTYQEYEAASGRDAPTTNPWGAAKVLPVPKQAQPPPPPPRAAPEQAPLPSTWASAARQLAGVPVAPAAKVNGKAADGSIGVRAVSVWADAQLPPSKAGALLVGGELPEEEAGARLTKAQKKNMRRLERKAAQRAAADTSVASSEVVSDYPETVSEVASDNAAAQQDTAILDESSGEAPQSAEERRGAAVCDGPEERAELSDHVRCIQALIRAKARYLMGQLQSLGWQDWQCAPALLAHGSNLQAALAFLLEDCIASADQAKAFMAAVTNTPNVDVSEELAMVAEAQSWLGLPMAEVERAVAQCGGDINAAVLALAGPSGHAQRQQLQRQPSPASAEVFAAALVRSGSSLERSSDGDTQSSSSAGQHRQLGNHSRRQKSELPALEAPSTRGNAPPQWGSSGSDNPPLAGGLHSLSGAGPARHAPSWQPPVDGSRPKQQLPPSSGSQQPFPRSATEERQLATGSADWAGTNGGLAAQQEQQHTQLPHPQQQQQQQQWPGSGADPSSMWAVLRALQPEEASSPPTSGLPSQSDLWSCLGVHTQPPTQQPKDAAEGRSDLPVLHPLRRQQQQHQGTPLQNGREQEQHGTHSVPMGSRLFTYTSGTGPDMQDPARASPNLAPCAAPSLHGQPQHNSLWDGRAPAAAVAGVCVNDSSAGVRPSIMQSLERYQQLLQQVPGGSTRSSLDSSAPSSSFSGLHTVSSQRHTYTPALSPGAPQQQQQEQQQLQLNLSSWSGLPLSSATGSIWSASPTPSVGLGMEMPEQAFLAAAAAAAATEASQLHGRDAEHEMADLELDSLMATLMCS